MKINNQLRPYELLHVVLLYFQYFFILYIKGGNKKMDYINDMYNKIGDFLVSLTFADVVKYVGIFVLYDIAVIYFFNYRLDYLRSSHLYNKNGLKLVTKNSIIPFISICVLIYNHYPSIINNYIALLKIWLVIMSSCLILYVLYIIKFILFNIVKKNDT